MDSDMVGAQILITYYLCDQRDLREKIIHYLYSRTALYFKRDSRLFLIETN
jgi:hypothetical protein